MQQLQGYEQSSFTSLVCKLNHALYGLKQAPLEWLRKIDNFFKHNHMNKSSSYGNLYYLQCNNKVVILILYVDDFFSIGDIDHERIVWLKQ